MKMDSYPYLSQLISRIISSAYECGAIVDGAEVLRIAYDSAHADGHYDWDAGDWYVTTGDLQYAADACGADIDISVNL